MTVGSSRRHPDFRRLSALSSLSFGCSSGNDLPRAITHFLSLAPSPISKLWFFFFFLHAERPVSYSFSCSCRTTSPMCNDFLILGLRGPLVLAAFAPIAFPFFCDVCLPSPAASPLSRSCNQKILPLLLYLPCLSARPARLTGILTSNVTISHTSLPAAHVLPILFFPGFVPP